MHRISLSVSTPDYETLRSLAEQRDRPIAELIREAMAEYIARHPRPGARLTHLPTFSSARYRRELPDREALWGEIAERTR